MKKSPSKRHPVGAEVVYGLRAGLAVFERHPSKIIRIAFHRETRRHLTNLERWASAHRIPYVEVSDDELNGISGAKNHEGLCLETEPRSWATPQEFADMLVRTKGTAIALERIRNPYNIGAILRSAAFFGLDAALLGAPAPHPGLPADAVRVAEGGAEQLEFARTTDLPDTLGRLRAKGITVIGAESEAPANAIGFSYRRPVVVVLGHERDGLSERAKAQCDALVAIPGLSSVRSLNVSVAASVLLAEVVRDRLMQGLGRQSVPKK
ncbi:MAG TPA: RNA methyltransferase [Polyangium sp.]|nr:RNA methyltransferase [Polyangium sp.]